MTTHELYTRPNGHVWKLNEYGSIDLFAYTYLEDEDLTPIEHNGPECVNCGYHFCMHCKDNAEKIKPCTVIYYHDEFENIKIRNGDLK